MEKEVVLNALADEMIEHNKRKEILGICLLVIGNFIIVSLMLAITNGFDFNYYGLFVPYVILTIVTVITAIFFNIFNFKTKRSKSFKVMSIIEIVYLALGVVFLVLVGSLSEFLRLLETSWFVKLAILVFILILLINYLLYFVIENPIYKILLINSKKAKGNSKDFTKLVKNYLKPKYKSFLIQQFELYYCEEEVNPILETYKIEIKTESKKDNTKIIETQDLVYQYDSQLLQTLDDPDNDDNIDLVTENGQTIKFEQEYVYYQDGNLYCILKPLDKVDNIADDEAIVFVLVEDETTKQHTLKMVDNDELANKVFDNYYKDLDNQENIQNNEAKKIEVSNVDPIIEKKSYLVSTIVMGIIYFLILIIGILGVTKVLGNVLNSMAYDGKDILAGEALSFAIGMIFFSFIPTIGYFMAFSKLYNLQKKVRVIIFLSSLVFALIMIVVFFITYNSTGSSVTINNCDGTAYEQSLTIIVSHVGLLVIYLLTFLKINYEKLNKALSKFRRKASDEPSNTKFFTVIFAYLKQFFKFIARLFILLVRGILKLRDRSKPLYYSIFTIIFTILCFFTSFIALVIIIGIALSLLCLVFFGTLSLADTPTSTYAYEVNEGGYTRTLEYYDYYNGHDRYKDDTGNYWYTDDNGSTFYKE